MGDNMLNRLKTYIDSHEFRVLYLDGRVNIVNYVEILFMDDKRISISYRSGILVVKGDDLILSKLLDNEILIEGQIKSINIGDN